MPGCTLFADASFCKDSGAGGWAAWIIADGRSSTFVSGTFPRRAPNAGVAELMAIERGLAQAVMLDYLVAKEPVYIQSDSQFALGLMLNLVHGVVDKNHVTGLTVPIIKRVKITNRIQSVAEEISDLIAKSQVLPVVRHVKGHTKNGDGRSSVNRRCDKLARSAMRLQRSQLLAAKSASPAPESISVSPV